MRTLMVVSGLVALALVSTTAVAETVSYQFRSNGADVSGTVYSDDGCGYTGYYIWGSSEVNHAKGGAPTYNSWGWAYVYRYNWCTYQWSSGEGTLSSISVSGLQSASAAASFDLNEWDYSTGTLVAHPVTLSVSWTGNGEVYRGNSHSHYGFANGMTNTRWNGSQRSAAVSASLTIDGSAVALSEGYGNLNQANNGSVSLTHF